MISGHGHTFRFRNSSAARLSRVCSLEPGCAAIGGRELGFEDQRVPPIAALDLNFRFRSDARRGDLAAVVGIAQERRKTSRRVEPRPTQPVNGAIL
jgi:hypothetical protein